MSLLHTLLDSAHLGPCVPTKKWSLCLLVQLSFLGVVAWLTTVGEGILRPFLALVPGVSCFDCGRPLVTTKVFHRTSNHLTMLPLSKDAHVRVVTCMHMYRWSIVPCASLSIQCMLLCAILVQLGWEYPCSLPTRFFFLPNGTPLALKFALQCLWLPPILLGFMLCMTETNCAKL